MNTKLISILLLLFLIIGCDSKMLKTKEIKSIIIYNLSKDSEELDSVTINDDKKTAKIISIVNNSLKEPTKFIANYKLVFNYSHDSVSILVNTKYFLFNGVTYKMDENLEIELNKMK